MCSECSKHTIMINIVTPLLGVELFQLILWMHIVYLIIPSVKLELCILTYEKASSYDNI